MQLSIYIHICLETLNSKLRVQYGIQQGIQIVFDIIHKET